MINDLALGKALGTGRAHIVGVELFEHVGSDKTHQRTDADHDQGHNRQNKVPGLIQELIEGGHLVVVL